MTQFEICVLVAFSISFMCFGPFVTSTEESTVLSENSPVVQDVHIREETWRGILNFTLHLENVIAKLTPPGGNILFAPVNILGVLGALLLGAEGESRIEILDVLGVAACDNVTQDREEVLHSVLGGMLNDFVKEYEHNKAINVTIAKAIFLQKGFKVKKQFEELSKTVYNSEMQTIDFSEEPAAAEKINQWISAKTAGHIRQLLSPDSVSPATTLVLASALYFNGEWDYPFNENSTWEYFKTRDGPVLVKMMHQKGTVRVLQDRERKFQVLGLPYKGKTLIMYIILPDEGEDLRTVINKRLTLDDLYKIPKQSIEETRVSYFVPYMDFESTVDLKSVLQDLGLRTVFNENEANLSRISDDVYVSNALHKVNLQVTEAGTTGTASTAFIIETRAPDPSTVIVNRPFLFYIYHFQTGSITFWGTVQKPSPYKEKS